MKELNKKLYEASEKKHKGEMDEKREARRQKQQQIETLENKDGLPEEIKKLHEKRIKRS